MSSSSSAARPGRRLRAWLGALLMATGGVSQAGVSLSWDMADWQLAATPTQTLELRATVYNEASASEHLLGSRFVAAFGEGIEDAYVFLAPVVSLAEQFVMMDLAPGQGMDFVFGRLAPVGGRIAPGAYAGGGFSLTFRDANDREVSWTPDRTLTVNVAEAAPGQDLPEPATLLLSVACLAGLALQRRRTAQVRRSAACG